MKYISAIHGTFIILIVFIVAVFVVPLLSALPGAELILTISTFIFAVLAGFFIARLGSRYDEVRRLVAEEDANLLSLFKTAQIFGTHFAKRIANLIDHYYIVSYDHTLSKYAYKQSAVYYIGMWNAVGKIKTHEPQSAYQMLITQLSDIEKARNAATAISSERLSVGHWAMLIILLSIILTSLFVLRSGDWFSSISTAMVSTALILVVLIVRDLQNFMIGGKSLLEESGQEVLEFIGKRRYYQKKFVDNGISIIPTFVKEYRLGLHVPGSKKFKIIIVKQ